MNIYIGSFDTREIEDLHPDVLVDPIHCQKFFDSLKDCTVASISLKCPKMDEFNAKSFLIQTRRVLKNGGFVSILPPLTIAEEELVSASKLAGYGSKIERGKNDEYIFTKKVLKKFKLKKKEEEKKMQVKNPWADLGQSQDIIEETTLLEKDSQDLFTKFAKETDCMQKAKPCENCTCGRAKQEFGKKALENGQVQSNCGKCYLGDAYRCATCPFLGTPAFEAGDQVKLMEGGDQSSVPMEREETVATSSKGTVKIVL